MKNISGVYIYLTKFEHLEIIPVAR